MVLILVAPLYAIFLCNKNDIALTKFNNFFILSQLCPGALDNYYANWQYSPKMVMR